jgi:hypothetical protein
VSKGQGAVSFLIGYIHQKPEEHASDQSRPKGRNESSLSGDHELARETGSYQYKHFHHIINLNCYKAQNCSDATPIWRPSRSSRSSDGQSSLEIKMRSQSNQLQSRAVRRRLIVRADQSWRDAYAPLKSHSITIPAGKGKEITLHTGEIGRQASGAVMAVMGESPEAAWVRS